MRWVPDDALGPGRSLALLRRSESRYSQPPEPKWQIPLCEIPVRWTEMAWVFLKVLYVTSGLRKAVRESLRLPKLPLRGSESQSLIRALSACASSYEPIDNLASLLTVAKYRSGNLLVEKRAAST